MSGKVDGILIGEGFVASHYIERLAARVPVVVIAGTPGERAADVVAADNFSGSAAVITHLIADHGKRRLFHVDGPPDSPDAVQRRLALEYVLRGHPHCQLVGSTQGIFSVRSGEQAGEELLARHRGDLPEAVVCANDQMAIGVLRAFAAAGVRVPEEVAVVGFDDIYPEQPVRSPAHHRPPADADAGRAGLRPRPGAHRRPKPVPHRGTAADRARAAVELRLPARHDDPPARRDAEAPQNTFGRRQDGYPRDPSGRSQGLPVGPASSEGLGAAMSFIIRRLVFYLVTAWVALTINFFIPRLMPGNAVQSVMAKFPNLQPSAYKALEALLGVGHPGSLWHQYVSYLDDIFHLNFGTDVSQYPAQVSTLLGETIPWTITLVGTATVIAFLVGTALGIVAGWRHGGTLDRVLPGLMFLQAIPYFFFALILLELLAIKFHVFPTGQGYSNGLIPGWHWDFISSAFYHSLLPALTIVLTSIAGWMLQMRNVMITTSGEDYVIAAQAKGLPSRRVIYTYAARNALLPQLQGFGLAIGFVVSGALVMEIVFSYPGIGLLLLNAVTSNDFPLMQAIFLVITFTVLLANMIVDIIIVFADPRARREATR